MKRTALVAAGLAICLCSALLAEKSEPPTVAPEENEVVYEFAENPNEEMLIEQALLAQANVIKECRVTYYCAEPRKHICGYGLGVTKSGEPLQPYHSCAVDPDVIPLGSQVMVDFGDGIIRYFYADDTGGGVKGNHIDLCVTTHKEALSQPYNKATVYWIGG